MSRVIGVLSGKGGVGKTTVVANLGAALTNVFNKKVLIFDSNMRTSHLGLHLGMYEDNPVTLREILKGKIPLIQGIYLHPNTGIRIVPTPLSGDDVDLTKNNLSKLITEIKNDYDIIILDCAPGLGKEVISAISVIDEALVVTNPDVPAVTDALKTIDLLNKFKKRTLGIVVNRYRNQKYELTSDEINSTCECNVISKIPEDKKIPESIFKGMPIVLSYPNSTASIALKNLAAYLLGVEYVEESFIERMKRFFGFTKVPDGYALKNIMEPKPFAEEFPETREIVEPKTSSKKLSESDSTERLKRLVEIMERRSKDKRYL